MPSPKTIRVAGMYFDLCSQEEIRRANMLVRKNSEGYLVDSIYPSGASSPKPLLHHLLYGKEADALLAWVKTGSGKEPD